METIIAIWVYIKIWFGSYKPNGITTQDDDCYERAVDFAGGCANYNRSDLVGACDVN